MWKWLKKKQLSELRPLPLGKKEFETWSNRIILNAGIPGATIESQKFALAGMIAHVPASKSFESDAFFIHSLRKNCANVVAFEVMQDLRELKAKKEEQSQVTGEVLPHLQGNNEETKILADKKV